jgi:rhodanese-related sulfurtransferase/DNA-binding transcriptional ArsR family regulator
MKNRDFKDAVFQHMARMAQAFAAPKRLEILDVLAQGERDVETLAARVSATVANTSRHLQVLKQVHLVQSSKQGVRVRYRLANPEVLSAYLDLRGLSESRMPEVRDVVGRFFGARDELEPVPRSELLQRAERGEVVVLDVRPEEEYAAGHIPGARSVPLASLEDELEAIPTEREVVAYCRGPYCVLAVDAVSRLRRAGRRARRLQDGYPEWREAGLPVERGEVAAQGTGAER